MADHPSAVAPVPAERFIWCRVCERAWEGSRVRCPGCGSTSPWEVFDWQWAWVRAEAWPVMPVLGPRYPAGELGEPIPERVALASLPAGAQQLTLADIARQVDEDARRRQPGDWPRGTAKRAGRAWWSER